jgi:hypothetical protein
MKKFVVIIGATAVGKMTVGQELQKITGLPLHHNHMTIDLVSNFFDYGTKEGQRLVGLFRKEIFEAVAKSDLPGMIWTYMWAFDLQSDWDYIEGIADLFRENGAEVYFVELIADRNVRWERNKTENRRFHKPTKRDLEFSQRIFQSTEEKYRLVSHEGEITFENYLRIDNTHLEPEAVAQQIKENFSL